MAQASFSVNNGTAVAVAYSLASANGRDAGYLAAAVATASSQKSIDIKHTIMPVGQTGNDRHLVQYIHRLVDSVDPSIVHVAKVNVTFDLPRTAQFTAAMLKDSWYETKNYITDAVLTSLNQGITP